MKKIKKWIKKNFELSKTTICEKCGWTTITTPTTNKLKQNCKNCN
jgi:hypothetical protein